MTDSEFRNSFEKVLALKKNSFSRNLLLSYEEDVKNIRWNPKRFVWKDTSFELAEFLYQYPFLNVHAIDEGEAPIPFSALEEIYGDYVFVLQYLKKKNSLMLLLKKITQESLAHGTTFSQDEAIVDVFRSSWNYGLSQSADSYLDFGFVKSAMSLRKTYGIQDLLEVGLSVFRTCRQNEYKELAPFSDYGCSSCRFLFSIDHLEISTIALHPFKRLILQGKTKIVPESFLDKIRLALKIFSVCRTF